MLKRNRVEFDLTFATMERMLPSLEQLFEAEWENDEVKHDLENLRNEFLARLQHASL